MVLLWILGGTIVAGVGSVWIAALLSFGIMARLTKHMLSFAAGALLATALLQLLPEEEEESPPVRAVLLGHPLSPCVGTVLRKRELAAPH